MVGDAVLTALARTVRAAVHRSAGLMAVTDDRAAAVITARRDRVDRTLEGIEHVRLAAERDLHRVLVLVAAHLARRHLAAPSVVAYRALIAPAYPIPRR